MEKILHTDTKSEVFDKARDYIAKLGLGVLGVDSARPWGGFFVIDESATDAFVEKFFPSKDPADIKKYGAKLSPKILLVQPGEKLSWQYHNRRAEIWSIVQGPVGIVASLDDTEQPVVPFGEGQIRQFEAGERHRLVGLDEWGVVAEIWQHTDPNEPSNEEDIIRLSDNYGRQS